MWNSLLFLLLLNEVGNARLGESDLHHISPRTSEEEEEEKGKTVEDKTGASSLGPKKSFGPAIKASQSHTIEHRVSKIVPQSH